MNTEIEARTDQLIAHDIYARQDNAIAAFIAADDCIYNDIKNLYRDACQNCGESIDVDSAAECCKKCGTKYDGSNQVAVEVYEWWAVSEYLAGLLTQISEVTWHGPDCYIWGRCTTGQAIHSDGVIQRCAELVEKRLKASIAESKRLRKQRPEL